MASRTTLRDVAAVEMERLAPQTGLASNVSVRVPLEPDLEPLVSQWLREYKLRSFGSVALHLAFAALGAIGSMATWIPARSWTSA